MSFFPKFHPLSSLRTHYHGHPFRVFTACLKTIFFGHVFLEYFYSYCSTYGPSMLPTLAMQSDILLIDKSYRRGRGVQVGDIVAFASVVEPGERVMKRVVGLEGDFVMRNTPEKGSDVMLQVPEGHCWVIGDNMAASRDSRHFGPMPMALIQGKAFARVFPWSERKWLENPLTSLSAVSEE